MDFMAILMIGTGVWLIYAGLNNLAPWQSVAKSLQVGKPTAVEAS